MSTFGFYFKHSFIFLTIISSLLFAQNFDLSVPGQLDYSVLKPKSAGNTQVIPSVDPSIYLLGPGDALEIRSSKMPWVIYSGTVNESNMLYIPEFGMFNVDKLSLDSAKKVITAYMLQQNKDDEVGIILSSPKQVEVLVTGEAVNPGSYRLPGTMRVLDVISMAKIDSLSIFQDMNIRSISITIDGVTKYYDLAEYIANGTYHQNPYLYPGSIISVAPPTRWITVSGAVTGAFPDVIPMRMNERYIDIFRLFKLTDDADTNNISIYRKGFAPAKFTLTSISNVNVQNQDYVIVGSQISRTPPANISIHGEIVNPGIYPLEAGVSTARGVLAVAGGVSERGDADRIYIVRKDPLMKISQHIANDPSFLKEKTNQLTPDMIISGDYRIIPLSSTSDIALENGDDIIIPEKLNSVHVSGHVKKPGVYPFARQKDVRDYVDLAGGWTKKADRKNCKIVTAYNDHWIVKTDEIAPGDIIFVPERPEGEKLRKYDIIIRTLYYTATAILAYISIGDRLNIFSEE